MANPDIRRPNRHEELIKNLLSNVGIFSTMRDVLVFAACLGFTKSRKGEVDPAPNPIAWETMSNNPLFEAVVMMISASVSADTPEFLGDLHVKDRARLFEEFASGGLSIIEEEMSRSGEPHDAVMSLVSARMLEINANKPSRDNVFDPFDPRAN